jgi:hypothetical protein
MTAADDKCAKLKEFADQCVEQYGLRKTLRAPSPKGRGQKEYSHLAFVR